ncbi:hypothetical protein J6590_004083 [Homalodisca vitripennis]|nr:hypothetical protein J6590_004083 [Homalodisca vitripennis]
MAVALGDMHAALCKTGPLCAAMIHTTGSDLLRFLRREKKKIEEDDDDEEEEAVAEKEENSAIFKNRINIFTKYRSFKYIRGERGKCTVKIQTRETCTAMYVAGCTAHISGDETIRTFRKSRRVLGFPSAVSDQVPVFRLINSP